jgi:hypothetical protein
MAFLLKVSKRGSRKKIVVSVMSAKGMHGNCPVLEAASA